MAPKIEFWSAFWALFFVPSFLIVFLMGFDAFFMLEPLKISIFAKGKCIFLRYGTFDTCLKNACKMHSKMHGI